MNIDETTSAVDLINELIEARIGRSIYDMPADWVGGLQTAAESIDVAIRDYIHDAIVHCLEQTIRPEDADYGVFGGWLQQYMRDLAPGASLRDIAAIAEDEGYDVYSVDHGWYGDEDCIILSPGYTVEDFCERSPICSDISELGNIRYINGDWA